MSTACRVESGLWCRPGDLAVVRPGGSLGVMELEAAASFWNALEVNTMTYRICDSTTLMGAARPHAYRRYSERGVCQRPISFDPQARDGLGRREVRFLPGRASLRRGPTQTVPLAGVPAGGENRDLDVHPRA